ncbi:MULTISPECIES: DNA gyrase subunit A [Leptospirillum]|uniref:DNA gyrase subunit A n=4 Tax=Leptospirillum TaxID=179 RepID=A0A059XSN7_9BACT|nr:MULTISPECIES: DNA gyrase subunit A [Leptospirillum]EAY58023.1 MAG: DNA gyrase, A subunit [Leptospirillum rubarum]EDZ39888.1 MAG: DNA gyrase, A subunit [Leptospirillum sp. Group II '5-way CG']EIJ75878.1 MAG: DNA gyrase, A subunit [Leptospirillum sp. Group II 'C75']AFS52258.1 type IIA topoisomerase, A subunit [Leptospirillum ferriphilum ML-04]AIA29798.1 DNA gyrase subunit A [Leptospirillum ferriphilum YSK]
MPLIPFETVVPIDDEMKTAYLNYSMSVIVGRALPDVRDGLKPVQRRVLFAMQEMGVRSGGPYRKSARIVGDVIGKYHPHGDVAVYDTAVRLVQPFTLRYPLIDGQGNFGSVDGDAPAAMRYTEIRLEALSEEMMAELEEETVEFAPNYDESLQEPRVLPARLPLLLLNGSAGIAVGMATNIPPHNITEIIDGLLALIDNPDLSVDDLLAIVHGPDFPTGGLIMGRSGIESALRTGRGSIVMRGVAEIEESTRADRMAIIIREIPYQVNKARLIERIAELVREGALEGIADIRDESDRDGMRVVIDLKRDANPPVVLNRLYAQTPLQTSFGYNFVALVNQRPMILSLREALVHFLSFRQDVVTRRTLFRLRKARERFHILEGLKRAIDLMDQIIALIRSSASPDAARTGLVEQFAFSEIQARAILDMRLQRLTALERDKIDAEYEEVRLLIRGLEDILGSRSRLMAVIREEFTALRENYGDARRTRIVPEDGEISIESMIPNDPCYITLTYQGYIKRVSHDAYPTQRRGGKGRSGVALKEDDAVIITLTPTAHETILFFTDIGKVYRVKAHEIPEVQRTARGKPVRGFLPLAPEEKVTRMLNVASFEGDRSLVFVTVNGIIKRTALSAYSSIRQSGIIALTLREGDRLAQVLVADADSHVLVATRRGMAILFPIHEVTEQGRTASGVRAIRLREDDRVADAEIVTETDPVAVVTEKGYGKRLDVAKFRHQHRGGMGLKISRGAEKIGAVVSLVKAGDTDDLTIITSKGVTNRVQANELRTMGRSAQGVIVMRLADDDTIVSAVVSPPRDVEGEQESG